MRPALAFFLLAAAVPAQNQGIHLTNGVDGSVDYAFHPAMLPPTGLTVEAWLTYDDATLPPSTGLGNTSFGLPIPNLPTLSGVTLVMQFGFSHAACGPQGFSASNGVQFTVQ